jgi:hypothetical protein
MTKRKPLPIQIPKPVLPDPPPPDYPVEPNIYKAPSIRHGEYTLPLLIYPVLKPSLTQNLRSYKKISIIREYSETLTFLTQILYHARKEEEFLSNTLELRDQWDGNIESGVREITGMIKLLERMKGDMEMKQDIYVENALKEWVLLHPNVKFRPLGMKMRRSRRKQLRLWRTKVREIERNYKRMNKREKFMRLWESKWGKNTNVLVFQHPRQRKLKRAAKKLRKRKLGQKM